MQMAPMTITKYWALIYPYDTPLGLNWFVNGWLEAQANRINTYKQAWP